MTVDNITLAVAYTIICITSAAAIEMISVLCKSKALNIFAIAFACFGIGNIFIIMQAITKQPFYVILGNTISVIGCLLQYSGIRAFYKEVKIWTHSCWFILISTVIVTISFSVIDYNFIIRTAVVEILLSIFYVQMYLYVRKYFTSMSTIIKITFQTSIVFTLLLLAIRIIYYIFVATRTSMTLGSNLLAGYTFISRIILATMWMAAIVLLENAILLKEISRKNEQYEVAIKASNNGIWDWNLQNNSIYFSPQWKEMLGFRDEELSNELGIFVKLSHPDDKEMAMEKLKQSLNGEGKFLDFELRLRNKNSEYVWISVKGEAFLDDDGKVYRIAGSNTDISKLKIAEEKIKELSYRDQLTGLYNRHYLQEIIDSELSRLERSKKPITMVLFDIDYFKKINDTYGHPIGDKVLIEIAEITSSMIKDYDLLFRIGGEEFLLLMRETSGQDAAKIAERMRIALVNHKNDIVGNYTCTFGVGEKLDNESFYEWYSRVDKILYKGKEKGRNIVVCTDSM